MLVVVLLNRTDLPYSVETCPGCIQANRLAKLLEKLQLLLLTEHRLASGHALKLENEFGFLTPELLLDLSRHPIEPSGHLFLISTREPEARAFWNLRLYGNGAVGHPHSRYASDNVLLIFHVARGFETESKRYGVMHPVAIFYESMLW